MVWTGFTLTRRSSLVFEIIILSYYNINWWVCISVHLLLCFIADFYCTMEIRLIINLVMNLTNQLKLLFRYLLCIWFDKRISLKKSLRDIITHLWSIDIIDQWLFLSRFCNRIFMLYNRIWSNETERRFCRISSFDRYSTNRKEPLHMLRKKVLFHR